ncbi:RNA 2',3'-cyclic phosphodiesterase [Carboxylicivirga sp. A043]|uniref:RNA 2',3'-cyclic phosphodiesterase n=1 Tax=Carboxylicivirga litoralis TaxID=2816963 RepID=UPI0021CB43AF|nr:RNA 2',3'-cyclic phosphodiesterase [Carboxylicivirga sp. A043]MCU4158107.1 RNA 2',3'-cyclic phosphodiesterase [Carboxylicivirga sp. A043]
MRLFVAIDCEAIKDELLLAQKQFTLLKARFPKCFHLTLHFIGEVNKEETETIKKKLSEIKAASFWFKLSQLGAFASYSQKVIWCGVEESEPLIQLHHKINKAITGDDRLRKYTPHITLARIKKHQKMTETEKRILDVGLKKELGQCSLKVNHFILYESTITPQGPIYRVVKEYPV